MKIAHRFIGGDDVRNCRPLKRTQSSFKEVTANDWLVLSGSGGSVTYQTVNFLLRRGQPMRDCLLPHLSLSVVAV